MILKFFPKTKQDIEKNNMINNNKFLGNGTVTILICILLILTFPNIENGIYCETGKKAKPDFTLIYSSDINGYYKPCG